MEATIPATPTTLLPVQPGPAATRPIYAIEAFASMGGTLFTVGIFFYTHKRFGWGTAENFTLAATQGAVYVAGALLAHRITTRMAHHRAEILLQTLMAVCCAAGAIAGEWVAKPAVTTIVLIYTFLSAMAWPILESLVAIGASGKLLNRRLGMYNVVWPVVGAIALALSGKVIDSFAIGIFLFPAIGHLFAAWMATKAGPGPALSSNTDETPDQDRLDPELLRLRTFALWVSRLALPATYAVIYGLMPLMPALPAMSKLSTSLQTLVSSTWLIARWGAFVLLAASSWWHRKPQALVVAALLMLVAFVGITNAPSQWTSAATPAADLVAILLWQIVLGAALGVIYSGSLYFGMVLSEGSTEHSGYHEALIGLGWILGPAAGAVMEWCYPGNQQAGIIAVGCVIGASVLAVVIVSVVAKRSVSRSVSP